VQVVRFDQHREPGENLRRTWVRMSLSPQRDTLVGNLL
jgi:hypothetical protein